MGVSIIVRGVVRGVVAMRRRGVVILRGRVIATRLTLFVLWSGHGKGYGLRPIEAIHWHR